MILLFFDGGGGVRVPKDSDASSLSLSKLFVDDIRLRTFPGDFVSTEVTGDRISVERKVNRRLRHRHRSIPDIFEASLLSPSKLTRNE